MKIKKAELLITAGRLDQYPPEGPLEIAFAGRSNVGKSSLINTLVNRKGLARTSGQPGKTQTVNFYSMNDEEFRLVDLPGYGYAKVSKSARQKWAEMIEIYFKNRKSLIEVILLLDIRHEPGEHDKMMYDWIKACGFNGIIVATKSDKISRGNWQKHISIIAKKLGVEDRDFIIPFSSLKKQNTEGVLDTIQTILDINSDYDPLAEIEKITEETE
ncbi:GTP-binding protein EngB [Gottschalkia acidurici 9a]|uniref:Probable GTP-binding protein EngB n=1 Tax=Gottschalkia acidurici (strain ATCC 7906 / DSM 604 / BCRC 14475 / CIP 104303 / KCTC 5404 / NCIMB 10678 / 9a) TaxID=1128398 RepID=K0AY09_GOTA9|nr:ribosome biogenesis GTP-binding protein YihA/YsxC [Gottschalkia acidurici]AFS77640.1 GTP-binding protein EngB [Gottschalkia acidurici 9a]